MTDILDACCGSRMFWFDKDNPRVVFADNRKLEDELCDGRTLIINPDVISDFTHMNFEDESFKVVVFDPPHIQVGGDSSWLVKKYGKLRGSWKEDLKQGFSECFRVLKEDGILIFKWNETQIKVSEILALTDQKPLFGHKSGKRQDTHWICFMKSEQL